MNEEMIKTNLQRINLILEKLPKPTITQDEEMWTLRNVWALGIKVDLDNELKKIEQEKKHE